MFSAFAAALGAADKVVEMIQREPQLPGAGSLRPEAFAGRLELRDVSFSLPHAPRHARAQRHLAEGQPWAGARAQGPRWLGEGMGCLCVAAMPCSVCCLSSRERIGQC